MLVEIEYPDLFKGLSKEEIAELCIYAFDQLNDSLQRKILTYIEDRLKSL